MSYKEIPMVAAISYLYNRDKEVYVEYHGNYTKIVWDDCLLNLRRSDRFYIYEEEYKQISFKEALQLWLAGNRDVFYKIKNSPGINKTKVPPVPADLVGIPSYFYYPENIIYYIKE